ncbi:sensor histidine kinase [Aliikangiella coralliicola]|uniref:Sensor histidine kinase n=1 Tax=Aliikangiella coralliicola TaxID=2592383 RepID=A0A545TS03_9GAMM|nr:histidine kinase [Aliikangiella coralliicola]TQV80007.1 sensor histidine kinase [Aliikangiella coralliicola]
MHHEKLFTNSKHQFIILNIAGWAGYCLSSYVGAFYWDKPITYYWVLFIGSVLGLIVSFALRPIYRLVWDASLATRVTAVIFGSYVCSLIWVVPYNLIYWELYKHSYRPDTWSGYFWGISNVYYIFICWSCLYFGIKFYQGMQEASQRVLKANALAHEAQLKMLRYQLNPHFLFNTLNAISTLVLENQGERANEMVSRLSNFLRYSLDNDPMQKVTLEQEITTLNLYLGIEKVRFEERLELNFQIEPKAEKALIPSLILQPLVENSIKYAIAKSENGGVVNLNAKVFANELLLELRDNGPGVELIDGHLPNGRGVGVKNTKDRLKELYNDKHSFVISNVEPNGLQISIRLPYET